MNSPFEGLTKTQKNKLFHLLGVHIYKYAKNEEIMPTIKSSNFIGIILDGSAQIINIEYNGNMIIAENLTPDSVFGTNISATNSENYQIIAQQDTQVLLIDYDKLLNPRNQKYTYFNTFIVNLFDIIHTKIKDKSERIRVLEKKQIRERLLEYFEIEYRKTLQRNIYLPFTFRDLSDYLAINRSAMFRELKNLKEDNLIEVKGNKIKLLYK